MESKKRIVSNWDKLPVVMDTEMVAMVFNVTTVTIKNWLNSGEIVGRKVGRKWFFDKEYIQSLFDEQGGN